MIFDIEPTRFVAKMTWATSISTTVVGYEQRRALARAPRWEFTLEAVVQDTDLRIWRTIRFAQPGVAIQLPLWHREAIILDVPASDQVVIAKVDADNLAAGLSVMLRPPGKEHGSDIVVREITGVTDLGGGTYRITVDSAVGATIVAGASLFLLVDAQITDNDAQARWRLGLGTISITATSLTPLTTGGLGSRDLETFDGYTLLDVPPSVASGDTVAEQYQTAIQGLDADLPGPVAGVSRFLQARLARSFRSGWGGSADRQFWMTFFYVVRGSCKTFLVPTWRADLQLATIASGASVDNFHVTDTPDIRDWLITDSHRRIAAFLDDGSFVPALIDAIVDNLDGTLKIDLATPIDLSAGSLLWISFLETTRLAADVVEFEYASGAATFAADLVVIPVPVAVAPGS